MVNEVPAAHAWVTVTVQGPVPAMLGVAAVQVPEVAVVFVAVGAVHPVGTCKVTYEFAGKFPPAGAVNVNANWLVVDPAVTDVGDTAMVPPPEREETISVPVAETVEPEMVVHVLLL